MTTAGEKMSVICKSVSLYRGQNQEHRSLHRTHVARPVVNLAVHSNLRHEHGDAFAFHVHFKDDRHVLDFEEYLNTANYSIDAKRNEKIHRRTPLQVSPKVGHLAASAVCNFQKKTITQEMKQLSERSITYRDF